MMKQKYSGFWRQRIYFFVLVGEGSSLRPPKLKEIMRKEVGM